MRPSPTLKAWSTDLTAEGTCSLRAARGGRAVPQQSRSIPEGVLSQVRARSTRRVIAAIGMSGLLIAAAGCGSDDNNSSTSASAGTTSTAAAPAKKEIKVGLVTDIGGLNDRSFNTLANKGLETAKSSLGIQ